VKLCEAMSPEIDDMLTIEAGWPARKSLRVIMQP
jgi:hypothetical protein